MNIFKNDVVYAYEFKDRKEINSFQDLTKVTVERADLHNVPPIINGKTDDGELFCGIVAYKKEGELLFKNNKKYFISFNKYRKRNTLEKDKKGFTKEVREYKGGVLYGVYANFSLTKETSIKFRISEVSFENLEEIENFISLLFISRGELHGDYISFMLNAEEQVVKDYEVHLNNKQIHATDIKKQVFQHACSHKKPILATPYDFNKAFSLKLQEYEVRIVFS